MIVSSWCCSLLRCKIICVRLVCNMIFYTIKTSFNMLRRHVSPSPSHLSCCPLPLQLIIPKSTQLKNSLFVKYDILTEYVTLFWFISKEKVRKLQRIGNVSYLPPPPPLDIVMSKIDAKNKLYSSLSINNCLAMLYFWNEGIPHPY